jgi:hypothetical protein
VLEHPIDMMRQEGFIPHFDDEVMVCVLQHNISSAYMNRSEKKSSSYPCRDSHNRESYEHSPEHQKPKLHANAYAHVEGLLAASRRGRNSICLTPIRRRGTTVCRLRSRNRQRSRTVFSSQTHAVLAMLCSLLPFLHRCNGRCRL